MQPLTDIEYSALMQAIKNAQVEIIYDTFIDPYAEQTDGYNNETVMEALKTAEEKLMQHYLPY